MYPLQDIFEFKVLSGLFSSFFEESRRYGLLCMFFYFGSSGTPTPTTKFVKRILYYSLFILHYSLRERSSRYAPTVFVMYFCIIIGRNSVFLFGIPYRLHPYIFILLSFPLPLFLHLNLF